MVSISKDISLVHRMKLSWNCLTLRKTTRWWKTLILRLNPHGKHLLFVAAFSFFFACLPSKNIITSLCCVYTEVKNHTRLFTSGRDRSVCVCVCRGRGVMWGEVKGEWWDLTNIEEEHLYPIVLWCLSLVRLGSFSRFAKAWEGNNEYNHGFSML